MAFAGCKNLKKVSIGKGITVIDSCAFDGCINLADVYYNGTEAQWNQMGGYPFDKSVTLHFLEYSLTFEPNGGTGDLPSGKYAANIGIILSEITKSGYTFAGWSDGQTVYQAGSIYIVSDKNVTFTAQWNKILYNVTFQLDGGKGYFPTRSYAPGTYVTLPDNIPAKNGYKFIGWKIDYRESAIYQPGSKVIMPEKGLVIIAQWEKVYPITEFMLGRDNNSFRHNNTDRTYGFYGLKNYYIPDELFKKLTLNAFDGEIDNIKSEMYAKWGGSCFGIACTMALIHSGRLKLYDITNNNSYPNYYSLPLPYTNKKLLDAINYYQLSQFRFVNNPSTFTSSIDGFKTVLSNLTETLQKGHIVVLGYADSTSGHAILACGCEKLNDGSYKIKLYDENCIDQSNRKGSFQYMYVSSNHERFILENPEGITFGNTDNCDSKCNRIRYFELEDIYDVKPYSTMKTMKTETLDYMTIIIPLWTSYTITSDDGSTLHYCKETSEFSGTMKYEIKSMTFNDENSQLLLSIPKSKTLYLSDCAYDIEITAYSDEGYMSLEGHNVKNAEIIIGVSININKGVSDLYSFNAFISTEHIPGKNETNLISVSGVAEKAATVSYDKDNKQINATSESSLMDTSVKSYVGTSVLTVEREDTDSDNMVSVTTALSGRTFAEFTKATETSVTLEIYQEKATKCIVAVYDQNGKMISSGIKDINSITGEVTIECNKFDRKPGQKAKAFFLDSNGIPMEDSIKCSLDTLSSIE